MSIDVESNQKKKCARRTTPHELFLDPWNEHLEAKIADVETECAGIQALIDAKNLEALMDAHEIQENENETLDDIESEENENETVDDTEIEENENETVDDTEIEENENETLEMLE